MARLYERAYVVRDEIGVRLDYVTKTGGRSSRIAELTDLHQLASLIAECAERVDHAPKPQLLPPHPCRSLPAGDHHCPADKRCACSCDMCKFAVAVFGTQHTT